MVCQPFCLFLYLHEAWGSSGLKPAMVSISSSSSMISCVNGKFIFLTLCGNPISFLQCNEWYKTNQNFIKHVTRWYCKLMLCACHIISVNLKSTCKYVSLTTHLVTWKWQTFITSLEELSIYPVSVIQIQIQMPKGHQWKI